MTQGVFPTLQSFGRVWEGSVLGLLCMFGRIPQWSHLVLNFCIQGAGVGGGWFVWIFTDQVLLLVIDLFKFSVYWLSLKDCMFLETCPFLLGSSIHWPIILHSIFLWFFFKFLQYLLCLIIHFLCIWIPSLFFFSLLA